MIRSILKQCKFHLKRILEISRIKILLCKHDTGLRIIVGSANTGQAGWISTDYPALNLIDQRSFARLFKPESISHFLAEHVWEHLSPVDAQRAIHNCFEFLEHGGRLRIAVPDGCHPDEDYIAQVKPGGYGSGADDHKALYDFRSLSAMMEAAGFQVRLLEWFDEHGQFHFEPWSVDDGMVKRSTRYDPRNSTNPTTFTSLIIDGIKP
jgi:predicted SAM-dependent methyltransferase